MSGISDRRPEMCSDCEKDYPPSKCHDMGAAWEDVKDEWTEAIKAAHPTRSESHDEWGVAMKMVGHRHSKSELVALINWLLVRLRPKPLAEMWPDASAALNMVATARGWLESFVPGPETTRDDLLRELSRVRKTLGM